MYRHMRAKDQTLCRRLPQLIALVVLFFPPAVANSQESIELTAKSVIESYIEAIGGEISLRSVETLEIRGTLPSENPVDSFSIIFGDGQTVLVYETRGIPQSKAGFDGEYLWQKDEEFGYKIKQSRPQGSGFGLLKITSALEWLANESDVTLIGKSDVANRKAWLLHFNGVDDVSIHRYFDAETGLLFKSSFVRKGKVVNYFLEHNKSPINGVLFIASVQTEEKGEDSFACEVTSVVVNPTIDKSVFKMPEGLPEVGGK